MSFRFKLKLFAFRRIKLIYDMYNFNICLFKFQSKWLYPNGVKLDQKLVKQMDSISSDPSCDRLFINTLFMIVFSSKYIYKQSKKGLDRKATLNKFRDSNRYELMKNMYDYRVLRNGRGDSKTRMGLFKLVFRSKLNNWWKDHIKNV